MSHVSIVLRWSRRLFTPDSQSFILEMLGCFLFFFIIIVGFAFNFLNFCAIFRKWNRNHVVSVQKKKTDKKKNNPNQQLNIVWRTISRCYWWLPYLHTEGNKVYCWTSTVFSLLLFRVSSAINVLACGHIGVDDWCSPKLCHHSLDCYMSHVTPLAYACYQVNLGQLRLCHLKIRASITPVCVCMYR